MAISLSRISTYTPLKMSLPKVFAIYRRESETFQLLTYDSDENGNILRLKNWSRPHNPHGIRVGEEDSEATRWYIGTEWYVEPTSDNDETLHPIQMHDKEYQWWSLQHKLVWSSYMVYHNRHDMEHAQDAWANAPQIPVLEFSSRHIYPRMDVLGFYPRWASANPQDIELESDRGRARYLEEKGHVDPKDLRIRTPKPDEDEMYTTDEDEYAPRLSKEFMNSDNVSNTCFSAIILTIMAGFTITNFALIGAQLYGY